MKKYLLFLVIVVAYSYLCNAQAPVLGTSSEFALFSINGAVTNTGLSLITGDVGTNNGPATNFGNIDGVMQVENGVTAAAAADLTIAYNQLDSSTPTMFPAPLLGNGQTLNPATFSIGESASLDGTLTLDGQGDPNAVFIFQIEGAFSSSAASQVLLTNGTLACNVFWKVEGLVDLATNTEMKGTIVANNAAIVLNSGVTLDGRAFSTTGAVTVSGVNVTKPLGCTTPPLTGPPAPPLGTVACYTIFSGNGEVTNTGETFVVGDVGTNVGLTTGFEEANVTGTIHPNPDTSTAQCASDLNTVYSYLNTLPEDIQLLYPASFGNELVLTPHTYLLDAATVLTGNLFLNAQGNADAVFVIKINGALSTSTFAMVELINGAQAENVFWKVEGAVNINDFSEFKGTLIGNNGAMILNTGVDIQGRALTTSGGVSTFAINAVMTPGCESLSVSENTTNESIKLYPNPFVNTLTIAFDNVEPNTEIRIYNMLGAVVMYEKITQNTTQLNTSLSSGVYIYQISNKAGMMQTGKLIAQ